MLIVGAGVAGLALARALHRRGMTAEVVERMTEWQPSGAGLYLPANAVRALHELGIGPAVAARANPIRSQRLLDHRGHLLADIDLDRLWDGVGGCAAIQRAALHEALRDVTAEVPVRLGTSVTAMDDGDAPRVTFTADQSVDHALAGFEHRRKARVAWVQEQTHRRHRTRNLPPIVRNVTLRLAAARIFRSNYRRLRDRPSTAEHPCATLATTTGQPVTSQG